MIEIIPRTTITLLFNVPLTNEYINTYHFNNLTEQTQFFNTKFEKIQLDEQSYQRKERGWLRINEPYRNVYNANYMYFINIDTRDVSHPHEIYERKMCYAFITDVVYINDAVTEIQYEIDVLQTYMFDWEFEDVHIERESTLSDNVGEHLIDEGLPIGDYVDAHEYYMQFNGLGLGVTKYVVAATVNRAYEDTTDGAEITSAYGRIVSGCKLINFSDLYGDGGLLRWLNNLPGEKQGAILAIFLCPEAIINANLSDFSDTTLHGYVTRYQDVIGEGDNAYTPKNKKLLSSPYNNLLIKSSSGESVVFDYSKLLSEYDNYTGARIPFSLYNIYTFPVQGILLPSKRYKGDASPITLGLPLPQLPSCTWSNDTFKAWAALNTGYVATSMASSVIDAGVRVAGTIAAAHLSGPMPIPTHILSADAPHKPLTLMETKQQANQRNMQNLREAFSHSQGSILGDIQNIANNIFAIRNARIAPDSFNGTAINQLSAAYGYYGYTATQHCIRPDYARRIDQFFTMFGYKVDRIGKPSLKNRDRFTYIKTSNMSLHGTIPQHYVNIICNVFNAGIRWWDNTQNIGTYVDANGDLLENGVI